MTTLSVFGASAPPGAYAVYVDGTPSIRLGQRFYRYGGLVPNGATIVGGRVWLPAAVPGATGVRIMLWIGAAAVDQAPTREVTVPLGSTPGWTEGVFASSVAVPAEGTPWRIGYEFAGNGAGYVFAANLRANAADQSIVASPANGLALSEAYSIFSIGGNGEQSATSYAIGYGIDTLVADGVVVADPNLPPTANAGADQAGLTGVQVTLTGSGGDTDGTVIGYSWTQVGGAAVTLSGTGATRTFTPATAGLRTFRLTVTDDDGATTQDTMTVTTTAPDVPVIPSDDTSADFDINFRAGFGKLLAEAGIGKWEPFTAADTGIVDGDLPATPENAIALMSYGVSDDPTNSDSVIGLQVQTRAKGSDPRGTARLTGKVYDQLHGLTNVVLPGGVYVVQCYRQSWLSVGQDENNRWREKSNFYVTVHRPSKYRV